MIAFWNRREIYVGNSLQEFNRILDILAKEKIKYHWKRVRAPGISGLMGTSHHGMYYIYVHRKDADKAQFLIRRR